MIVGLNVKNILLLLLCYFFIYTQIYSVNLKYLAYFENRIQKIT